MANEMVSMTYGDLPDNVRPMIEGHVWDNKNISEQRDWAVQELARLRAGRFTKEEIHDICHNLHGTVPAQAFADGCAAEQMKLYGTAPDRKRYEELEHKYRVLLWMGHGHTGQYGDDGEMQCGMCIPFGAWDYKRTSLSELEEVVHRVQRDRLLRSLIPGASER